MPYARFSGDIPSRVDFNRLRIERREKAKKAMEKYGLDAVICFLPENCRYLTIGPRYVFYRYVVYARTNGEPILHDAGMVEDAYRRAIPWLRSRPSVPLPPGLIPSNEPAYNYQVSQWVEQIKGELKELDVFDGKIGIDIPNPALINALKEVGINISQDGGKALAEARTTRTRDEIELTRIACSIVEAGFQRAREVIRPGVTEQQVWAEIVKVCWELGADGVQGGLVDSGPHTWPRANVITDRIMRYGDIVLIDIYDLSYYGYKTCYYRDFVIGKPTSAQKEAWEKARELTWDSIRKVKPGVTTRELVEGWPEAKDFEYPGADEYGAILAQWGHGVGLTLYEAPMISRAWSIDYPEEIKEGMVFALETLVPTNEITPDYPHGQCLRIEEMVHVTKDGYDLLSKWPIDEITQCW